MPRCCSIASSTGEGSTALSGSLGYGVEVTPSACSTALFVAGCDWERTALITGSAIANLVSSRSATIFESHCGMQFAAPLIVPVAPLGQGFEEQGFVADE